MSTTVPIAITGMGVVTPLGDSLDAFAASLRTRRTVVPHADGDARQGRIVDFEATRYIKARGLRLFNRPTQLAICAAKLALADAGCEKEITGEQLGVVVASTYAHLETLFEYDRSLVVNGPAGTNPALVPVSIPSAPGAAAALCFGAKALAVTLSDGGASSLEAIGLAARLLSARRARACIVASAFTPFEEFLLSASRAGLIAPAGAFCVFDRARCGTTFGEAAAALILERAEDAIARGARLRAMLAGQSSAFAVERPQLARALRQASERALALAGIAPGELALVSSAADGSPSGDRSEAEALVAILGEAPVPIMAIKGNLGDSPDCAGFLQTIAATMALGDGLAIPIARLRDPEVGGLRYAIDELPLRGHHALVTSKSSSGACSALVVSGPA
ncbi:MAG TPA: beta-ketoacyl synthase N-terminal-like domain-containing protein [Anaeromyxobacteraceae bacterium]|nr:beta-ketoacyl synthase N-terminal-like domain-containing protein [Anaeromyxobacteraceae bacterium]